MILYVEEIHTRLVGYDLARTEAKLLLNPETAGGLMAAITTLLTEDELNDYKAVCTRIIERVKSELSTVAQEPKP